MKFGKMPSRTFLFSSSVADCFPKSFRFQTKNMAATVLLPAVNTIVNGLIPLVTQQINLAWSFEKDLRKLQRRLEMIQALLCDAENRPIATETLKTWLKSLKSVACDAENVLGELAYEALRSKLERKRDKVRKFFSTSNSLAFRLKFANGVSNINLLLDEICKEANEMGLRPAEQLAGASVSLSVGRSTIPFVDKSRCVGRDGDVVVVRDMLLGSTDDLSVIAIVGMAGLGKSTLAQLVYHDRKVVEYFGDNKMWICVSDDFNVKRLLNEMVQSLFREASKIPNIEGIVGKLGEKLKGKKFLLVLDDVWNTIPQIWEELRSSLIGIEATKESKIIVTTRSVDVVSAMQVPQSLTHRLRGLSANDSWTMFRKKAFARGGPLETKALVDIGGKMVEKCKGVPLAISSLGGLLYGKKSLMEWLSIEEGEIWRLVKDGEILPVLRLSFHHLPSNLKQCFASCSIFRKDHVLLKDALIQLWVGLGYIQPLPEGDLEMEDVGNEYFKILLHNSLFQDVELDENNDIVACKMHDLVHDLALDVSEGSCLTLEAGKVKDHPKVQHLSLCLEGEIKLELSDKTIGKLRTLFLTGNLPPNTEDVKSIRALSIVESRAEEFSSSIGNFIHLKYLDLSKSSFSKVPNSITKLYNLETLRLPPSSNLEEIQTEFHKLVSLRHLYVKDTKISRKMIPTMIGHLTSLQTLPFFSVGKDQGHKIEELGSLSKLRGRLIVYDLQHVKDKEEAERAKMFGKSKIKDLRFHWDGDNENLDINYEDVLEGLRPHKNLRHLVLKDFGGRKLASWMSGDDQVLQNLVRIELIGSKLCEEIPILGHLPHLEVIEMKDLDNVERIGPKFYGMDKGTVSGRRSIVDAPAPVVFPALRRLTIRNMRKLKEWSDIPPLPLTSMSIVEFFPRLEELYISECPNLITIPGHLLSIQDLYIGKNDDLFEKEYIPRLIIKVDHDWKDIGILIEHLLETSSKSLRLLQIRDLNELRYVPKQLLNLASLEALAISNCPKLMQIREETRAEFNRLTALQEISIECCNELTCLPKGLLQPALVRLKIFDCSNLSVSCSTLMDPYELPNLTSLQKLSIFRCQKLTCFPKGLLQPTLVSLQITLCPNLMEANPDELRNLTSLEKLVLVSPNPGWARCWEKGQFCLTSLRRLDIGLFSNGLDYFPWPEVEMAKAQNPQHYPFMSLESLTLWGPNCLSDQLRHLTSLRKLVITDFRGFEVMPEWLGNLSSLESLTLRLCHNLTSFPSPEKFQLLKKLQCLEISECPKALSERCKEGGEEWYKIAHIPELNISDYDLDYM